MRPGLTLVVLTVLALAGCAGGATDDATKEPDVDDRPTMETVVARYERLREDLFRELGERFGEQAWAESANSRGMSRSGCSEVEDGEHVHLPGMSFRGTYAPEDWHGVRQVVEEVAGRHGFADVAVVAAADERLGEVPVAFVVARNGVDDAELTALCRDHLAPYKVPARFVAVDELPRNDVGKLLRRELPS